MKVVHEIAYPNGKIYVGKDLTGNLTYFGGVNSQLVEADFTPEQRRDFTIRKQILWESETTTDAEVSQVEVEFIRQLRADDPAIGYNRWPRFVPTPPAPREAQPETGAAVADGQAADVASGTPSSGIRPEALDDEAAPGLIPTQAESNDS